METNKWVRIGKYVVVALLILISLDVATTYVVIKILNGIEVNPLLSHMSMEEIILVQSMIALLTLMLYIILTRNPIRFRKTLITFVILCAIGIATRTYAVLNNSLEILKVIS